MANLAGSSAPGPGSSRAHAHANPPQRTGAKEQRTHRLTHARQLVGMIGGPLLALIVLSLPIDGLGDQAHRLLAIMVMVCIWWVTEPVPIPVTALTGAVLAVITGVAEVDAAFAKFASPIIFLFLGGFILARAMTVHQLDKRFAYALLSLKWVGSNTSRIFLAVGVATTLCSGWISDTATAAMMLPITLGLLSTLKDMLEKNGRHISLHKYKYATGLMLMTAYAASIGGVLTPIGTPPNLIVTGLLATTEDVHISFVEWMSWGAIATVTFFIIASVVLHFMFRADVKTIDGAAEMIRQARADLGPWTLGQKCTLACFLLAVTLWVVPGIIGIAMGSQSAVLDTYNTLMPESVVALVASILLFLLPSGASAAPSSDDDDEAEEHGMYARVLTWKQAAAGVNWGTLLLFGGGLSLGALMYSTGLSQWVGTLIVERLGGQPSQVMLVATFCVLALVMSELSSHTVSANMVGPLGITTAVAAGLDPVPVAVGIALSASLGFMLPVSTPANAIAYSSGYIPITQMIKTGVIIDAVGISIVTIPLVTYFVTLIV